MKKFQIFIPQFDNPDMYPVVEEVAATYYPSTADNRQWFYEGALGCSVLTNSENMYDNNYNNGMFCLADHLQNINKPSEEEYESYLTSECEVNVGQLVYYGQDCIIEMYTVYVLEM